MKRNGRPKAKPRNFHQELTFEAHVRHMPRSTRANLLSWFLRRTRRRDRVFWELDPRRRPLAPPLTAHPSSPTSATASYLAACDSSPGQSSETELQKRVTLMYRRTALLALFVLSISIPTVLLVLESVSAATLHAAPPMTVANIDPARYFPLQLGNRWTYTWSNNVYAPSLIAETITVSTKRGDEYTLAAAHKNAHGEYYLDTSSGYTWKGWSTQGSNPFPLPMYMLPAYMLVPWDLLPSAFEVGDSWTGTGRVGPHKFTGNTTVMTVSASVQAAGRLYSDCLHLRTLISGPDAYAAGSRDMWFAPDVGLVKLMYNHDDGSVTTGDLWLGPDATAVLVPLVVRNLDTSP